MAKKRKPQDVAVLEELENTVFQNFTAAANSISQLYASADAHRRITFHAGEQHGLEKVRQWILARQEEGQNLTEVEIIAYLQNELGYSTGDAPVSPTSHSIQASSANIQMLASDSSVQNLQILQGVKPMKMFGFTNAPASASKGSPSLHIAQGPLWCDSSLQVPQTGSHQMLAGNCLPHAFAHFDHLNQEQDLSDCLDSAMDMSIEDQPN